MIPWLISLHFLPGRLFSFSWVGSTALIALPEGKQWCTKKPHSSFISPLYVTGRKSETIIPLLQAYFRSLLVIWNLWRSLRSCILHMLKILVSSSGRQLTWGYMPNLVEADVGFSQPLTKEAKNEPVPIWERDYHATLSPSVTAGQHSPPSYISYLEKLPLKILHLLLLSICLDVPLALDSHTKAHCSALFSH